MGLYIKIKQPESKIDTYRIEELWQSVCTNAFGGETDPRIGMLDEFYRMDYYYIGEKKLYDENKLKIFDKINDYLLFDNNNYGSGINLWFDNNYICMRAPLSATYSELISLYKLVNILCKEFNTKEFYRGNLEDFELSDISQLNWFLELGINDLLLMLERMNKEAATSRGGYISVNGVVNPLDITSDNLKNLGIDLPLANNIENITTLMKNYENFMNKIQQRDLFYSVFKLYRVQKNETQVINGYISVATDCDTILPQYPKYEFYFVANRYDTSKIDKFYAILENNKGNSVYIEYDEFLRKIDFEKREKYDGGHFIVRLNTSDIEKIID